MADYYPLIARAIAGLDPSATGESRRALYERARAALIAQLRSVQPPLSESEITRERLSLEEAVRKVESEAAQRARDATRPAWRPVAGFLRWISPLGWAVLGLGILALLVGRRFAWVEWMMIATGALTLFVLCVVLAVGRTKVSITTEVEPVRVTVGQPATGRVQVTNESKRGMLPILV